MKKRALAVLLTIFLLGLGLAACGGSDESSTGSSGGSTAAGPAAVDATGGQAAAKGGEDGAGAQPAGKASAPSAAEDGGGASAGKPASLKTRPASIPRAIVTATGAVQTLPPSAASQAEAMENSYASIREFGAESSGSEATDITFALAQYLTAKAAGDTATACARLYSVLREKLVASVRDPSDPSGQGTCPAAYASLTKEAPRASSATAAEIDVASVRRGPDDRAFVIYKTPDTLSADMPMYLEDGVWTVGALEAYVLTPAQLGQGQG